jgi:hypothetical protein
MADLGDEPPREIVTPAIEQTRNRFLEKYKQQRDPMVPPDESTTLREIKRRNKLMRKQLIEFGKDPAKHNEHEPTEVFRKQVRIFTAMNFSEGKIAELLSISKPTLRKHYKWELEHGADEHIAEIAANLLSIAKDKEHRDGAKVAMWWFERRIEEFRPVRGVEVTGKDGGPITSQQLGAPPILDSRKMTYEQRQRMRALLTEIAESQGQLTQESSEPEPQ